MSKEHERERREAVTSADATGMIAGEELITQADTMLPILAERPPFPHQALHAALPEEHPAHVTVDRLRDEIQSPKPNRHSIENHARSLRSLPALEATVADWWDRPDTQRFIFNLSQIGL